MKIYIDESLPESCASCQFLVHCDECEGHENYCPFIGHVGYDPSDDLITGAPVTPTGERHEECPLVQMPHCFDCHTAQYNFCPNCGSDNRLLRKVTNEEEAKEYPIMKKKDADKIAEAFKRLHCEHEWIDEGQYAEGHSEHYYQCKKCGKRCIVTPDELKGGV